MNENKNWIHRFLFNRLVAIGLYILNFIVLFYNTYIALKIDFLNFFYKIYAEITKFSFGYQSVITIIYIIVGLSTLLWCYFLWRRNYDHINKPTIVVLTMTFVMSCYKVDAYISNIEIIRLTLLIGSFISVYLVVWLSANNRMYLWNTFLCLVVLNLTAITINAYILINYNYFILFIFSILSISIIRGLIVKDFNNNDDKLVSWIQALVVVFIFNFAINTWVINLTNTDFLYFITHNWMNLLENDYIVKIIMVIITSIISLCIIFKFVFTNEHNNNRLNVMLFSVYIFNFILLFTNFYRGFELKLYNLFKDLIKFNFTQLNYLALSLLIVVIFCIFILVKYWNNIENFNEERKHIIISKLTILFIINTILGLFINSINLNNSLVIIVKVLIYIVSIIYILHTISNKSVVLFLTIANFGIVLFNLYKGLNINITALNIWNVFIIINIVLFIWYLYVQWTKYDKFSKFKGSWILILLCFMFGINTLFTFLVYVIKLSDVIKIQNIYIFILYIINTMIMIYLFISTKGYTFINNKKNKIVNVVSKVVKINYLSFINLTMFWIFYIYFINSKNFIWANPDDELQIINAINLTFIMWLLLNVWNIIIKWKCWKLTWETRLSNKILILVFGFMFAHIVFLGAHHYFWAVHEIKDKSTNFGFIDDSSISNSIFRFIYILFFTFATIGIFKIDLLINKINSWFKLNIKISIVKIFVVILAIIIFLFTYLHAITWSFEKNTQFKTLTNFFYQNWQDTLGKICYKLIEKIRIVTKKDNVVQNVWYLTLIFGQLILLNNFSKRRKKEEIINELFSEEEVLQITNSGKICNLFVAPKGVGKTYLLQHTKGVEYLSVTEMIQRTQTSKSFMQIFEEKLSSDGLIDSLIIKLFFKENLIKSGNKFDSLKDKVIIIEDVEHLFFEDNCSKNRCIQICEFFAVLKKVNDYFQNVDENVKPLIILLSASEDVFRIDKGEQNNEQN